MTTVPLTELKRSSIVPLVPPPTRYTLNEWQLDSRLKERCCLSQQSLADKVLAECERVIDVTGEVVGLNKKEVDHKLKEKVADIEFLQSEIKRQRAFVETELDNLSTFYERIFDAMKCVNEGARQISPKCLALRENRLGIDLVHDDVERELFKEIQVIENVILLLTRTGEQAQEQMRRCRATLYLMDRDLEAKEKVANIDRMNLRLNEHSLNLSMYHGFTPLDCSNISQDEWEQFTRKSIEDSAKEINSARQLRAYVNNLLSQACADLIQQYNVTQAAFKRRIQETKDAKAKLEIQHSEIVRQVNEIGREITQLEKAIADKEGFMALNHTRMGNRAQRIGPELCKDLVETKLVDEGRQIRKNVVYLQQMLAEAQATQRYLLKTQIQLEEDINIKINTLQIDEVDCMTLREAMSYHFY